MSNYDKRSFREAKLIPIWEELFRPDNYLATFIWEGQNRHCTYIVILVYGKLTCG